MQLHEKWAVVVSGVALIAPVLTAGMSSLAGAQPWVTSWWWSMMGQSIGLWLVGVVVGAWLAKTAKRDGHSPFVWFAMGAVFSLIAAVLYFLLRVLDRTAPAANDPSPSE